jgi:heptosyltransferase-2
MLSTHHINNVLIIKPGAIGDLLQLTPVFRALKGKYPDARISLVVSSRATASLFSHNPLVHEIIVFDSKGEHRSLGSLLGLWRRLRRARYNMVLNFQRSNLKAWFLASAAFPCRLLVYHKAKDRVVHAVVNHLETVFPLGIDASDPELELYTGVDDEEYAEKLFADAGFTGKMVIALNPGASHPVNRWHTRNFALLADRIEKELSAKVLIIGGIGDLELAQEIVTQAQSQPLVLTGKTDLLQLAAILRRCNLLVSADTGPMHMASAVGTRVLALFGAADPGRTGPVGVGHKVIQSPTVPCVPCRRRKCSNGFNLECMEKITVDEVSDVVAEMLS